MWKKNDKNNLPRGYCLFSFGIPEICFYGRMENRDGVPILHKGTDTKKLIGWPKYYLDPKEIPFPGEVELDWFEYGPDYGRHADSVFQGRKYICYSAGGQFIYRAEVWESDKHEHKHVIGNDFSTIDAAKSACEKYAAEMINKESKPETN